MEFSVPAGSRMNPVSTPFVVVEARPSAVWWNQVEPSLVRSALLRPPSFGQVQTCPVARTCRLSRVFWLAVAEKQVSGKVVSESVSAPPVWVQWSYRHRLPRSPAPGAGDGDAVVRLWGSATASPLGHSQLPA
jgi:hypothetical protein